MGCYIHPQVPVCRGRVQQSRRPAPGTATERPGNAVFHPATWLRMSVNGFVDDDAGCDGCCAGAVFPNCG